GGEHALEARKKKSRLGLSGKTMTPICEHRGTLLAKTREVTRGAHRQMIFADFALKHNNPSTDGEGT
ncbi:MAG: hypothetical protein CMH52_09865, partial [Myxococcales bacterium]|nr:hypothetical protein [Myxococcales bacterium]